MDNTDPKTTAMNKQLENRQIVYVVPPHEEAWGKSQEEGVDLFVLWNLIWKRKFFIVGFTFVVTLVAVYVTLFVMPVTYQSKTVLLPTGANSGQLGSFAGLSSMRALPISLPMGGGSGSELIMTFLNSSNLKLKLIDNYELMPRLYKKLWDPEKKVWRVDDPTKRPTPIRAVQEKILDAVFTVSKDSRTELVTILWVDEDPAFAAEMLQRVIAELNYYLVNDYESDAKRERKFVEKQLASATAELELWERRVPTDDVSMARIKRETFAATTVYTELRKQLELAKLTEEKEVINFKVIDSPFVPEVKFKPKRGVICAMTMVTAAFMALVMVFVHESFGSRRKRKKKEL